VRFVSVPSVYKTGQSSLGSVYNKVKLKLAKGQDRYTFERGGLYLGNNKASLLSSSYNKVKFINRS